MRGRQAQAVPRVFGVAEGFFDPEPPAVEAHGIPAREVASHGQAPRRLHAPRLDTHDVSAHVRLHIMESFPELSIISGFSRTLTLPCEQPLPDGSYLSTIYPSPQDRRRQTHGVSVRVIDYRLEGVPDAAPTYRLLTTLRDPAAAPAAELAAAYHERWEIETAFDELKTHLRGAQIVLRSKTPTLVRQEFHGLLLAHVAVRGVMHEAALRGREDPDRLSFVHAVRVIRRTLPRFAALPPSGPRRRA